MPLFAGQHVLVGHLRHHPKVVPDLRRRVGEDRGQSLRHRVRGVGVFRLGRAAGQC